MRLAWTGWNGAAIMAGMSTCPLCAAVARPFALAHGRRYASCDDCGLAFLDPAQRLTPEEELAEYRLHRNDPADPFYRRHLAKVATPLSARLKPGAEGLDYGCGPGPALVAMMEEAGFAVRGYDPFFCPDESALARRYGFVTCTETVEHFCRPAAEWARLDGLLEPGGVLAVMTRLLTEKVDFPRWSYIRERSHVVFYRPRTMEWLAARFGWEVAILSGEIVFFTKGAGFTTPAG
ncbi:class I SAM-dependent methyltransferase [Geminicoccaceae bacterium 1502E]|nr:class I SAM-dependent methyltransferase [Geminicoccaceae bacterium 1502E]